MRRRCDRERCARSCSDPACGGYVAFEGWVRDSQRRPNACCGSNTRPSRRWRVREGERILAEARAALRRRARPLCASRRALAVGELAVWVGVSAAHRGEAFDACRYIIDEVKHRVPIWKKEYYQDGDSGWVNCEHCAARRAAAHRASH